MTTDEKKSKIQGMVDKLRKSNERETSVRKEIADDRLALKEVQEMELNGDPLPVDSPYATIEEWKASMEKEVLRGENSLANIEENKLEVEALQYYLDNVA